MTRERIRYEKYLGRLMDMDDPPEKAVGGVGMILQTDASIE